MRAIASSPLLPLALACGLGCGLGVWTVITAVLPAPPADLADHAQSRWRAVPAWWAVRRRAWTTKAGARRAALALAAAVAAAVITRWPVGTLLTALAAWSAPALIGPDNEAAAATARIEALAAWTETLRDTVGAAAGLEQAVTATAPLAPGAIRPQAGALAARLASGERLTGALRDFADELADPLADLVVAALLHAADQPSRRLGDLLGSLAAAARAQASMRRRVEAGRATVRTSARMITAVTAAIALALVALDHGYLAPYDSPGGQLVLALVGAVFAAAFAWLRRAARYRQPARILTPAARRGPNTGTR